MRKNLNFYLIGSITDSICTAYENSSMITSGSKTDNLEVILTESDENSDDILAPKKNFKEMLEGWFTIPFFLNFNMYLGYK